MTVSNEMENISEKIQTIKESQMKILELESITKMKNSLAWLNSRLQVTEEREYESRVIELAQSKGERRKKKMMSAHFAITYTKIGMVQKLG